MKLINKILIIITIVFLLASAAAAYTFLKKDTKPFISETEFKLDTVCTISLYDKQDKNILNGAFELISRYENLLSVSVSGSDIYRINHSNGNPVIIDPDTADIIRQSISYSEESAGLFDITIGALTSLWNIEGSAPQVPAQDKIDEALKTIGYKNIILSGDTVTLLNKDTQIDLGGVAKGYIADKVRDYLISNGVGRAIINLGGNIIVIGSKSENTPWVVGVQEPFKERNVDAGYLYLSNKSVVTSGIYERYFIQDGKLYAHILDPRTGYPVENDLSSVTIISQNSKQGDGLAAACLLLGADRAKGLVESLDNIEAIFITRDGNISATKGIGTNIKFIPRRTRPRSNKNGMA